MSSVDAAWLGMEDPTNLMMVTGVMALSGPVDLKRLQLVLDRRLAPFARFHQRVVRPRSRANLPHWEDDPSFDVQNHLTHVALAAPGDDAALRKLVSDLMSEPLDFSKPLWHMHVVDGYQGGSVVLARVHHSIADGIALVRVLLSLTDDSPGWKAPARPRRPSSAGFRLPLDWLPAAVRRGVSAGQRLVSSPDRMLGAARLGIHGAYRLGRLVVLPPDPVTVFKGDLGRRKRAAWSETLPLDDFKAIGKAYGATVNDVLVGTTTGALRRYMERRGQPTAGVAIRASVPVNLRPLDRAHELGNAFGLVFLTLPIGIADPARRLRAIQMVISRFSPLLTYYHSFPQLSDELQYEWAELDTHDSLTDYYKHARSRRSIAMRLHALNAQRIWVEKGGNGVEARCQKPPVISSA